MLHIMDKRVWGFSQEILKIATQKTRFLVVLDHLVQKATIYCWSWRGPFSKLGLWEIVLAREALSQTSHVPVATFVHVTFVRSEVSL